MSDPAKLNPPHPIDFESMPNWKVKKLEKIFAQKARTRPQAYLNYLRVCHQGFLNRMVKEGKLTRALRPMAEGLEDPARNDDVSGEKPMD